MSKTVGRVLAESLIAHGIDTIWMVPGESFLGLTDALTEVPEMRLKNWTHSHQVVPFLRSCACSFICGRVSFERHVFIIIYA